MKKKRGNKEKIKKTRKGRKENMKCYKVNDRKFPSKFLRNSFNSNFDLKMEYFVMEPYLSHKSNCILNFGSKWIQYYVFLNVVLNERVICSQVTASSF